MDRWIGQKYTQNRVDVNHKQKTNLQSLGQIPGCHSLQTHYMSPRHKTDLNESFGESGSDVTLIIIIDDVQMSSSVALSFQSNLSSSANSLCKPRYLLLLDSTSFCSTNIQTNASETP